MSLKKNRRRALTTLIAFGLLGTLGACSDNTLLEVQNPGAVNETDLNDPLVQAQVVNTVVADFQRMFDDLVFAGALLSGEGVTGTTSRSGSTSACAGSRRATRFWPPTSTRRCTGRAPGATTSPSA